MSVKAKFICILVEDLVDSKKIHMQAVTTGSDENKEWSKWTPSGQLTMHITNPDAFNQFEKNKEYYLTIEEVPSSPKADDAGGSNPPGPGQPGKP